MRHFILALTTATILSGCGGNGKGLAVPTNISQTPPADYFVAFAEYDTMTAELAARSNTAFVPPLIEGMPSSGQAVYDGYLHAELDTAALTTRVLGLASVAADFSTGEMVGSASDFIGVDRTGAMSLYAGDISMSGGTVGVNRPNDFILPYSGSLIGNGETVNLSGTLTGDFKADPIRGILGSDTSPSATIDGAPFTGQVDLTAEVRP